MNSNLTFADAMEIAKANAHAPRQVQEGTPSGNSSQLDAWRAAISNKPPPAGSSPMERAADQWLEAMASSTAVAADEEALRARELLEAQAEAAREAADWLAYQASHPAIDPVRAAAQRLAQTEKDDARREAAYRVDAERADREVEALWRARELAAGVAS